MKHWIYKIFARLFLSVFNYPNSVLKQVIRNEIKANSLDFSDRYSAFKKKYKLSERVRFNGNMILLYGKGEIIIGDNTYISDYSTIQAYDKCKVIIGSNCAISSNVRIFTQSYVAMQDFGCEERKIYIGDVHIGNNVWIGANVLINPGLIIGDNSIVGANSVVTKNIPDNSIYGGVPAKLIKNKI